MCGGHEWMQRLRTWSRNATPVRKRGTHHPQRQSTLGNGLLSHGVDFTWILQDPGWDTSSWLSLIRIRNGWTFTLCRLSRQQRPLRSSEKYSLLMECPRKLSLTMAQPSPAINFVSLCERMVSSTSRPHPTTQLQTGWRREGYRL